MNEKDKKKIFRENTVMSIIITVVFLIAGVVTGGLIEKYKENLDKIVNAKLEKITIPSPILFHEEIKDCIDVLDPIKEGNNAHGDKIVNLKKVLSKCLRLEKKTLLRIDVIAGSTIDRMKLSTSRAGIGRHFQHQQKSIGFIDTRIFIDELERAGDGGTAVNLLQPGLYSSYSYSILLEPLKYKIKVEVTYYGYLAHPKASVKLTGERAEPVSLKELLKTAEEKEKNRAFLDIECKEQPQTFEKYKPVGIQPAVAGPFVNRNHEAQKEKKQEQGASHGVRSPEAETGRR